MKTKYTALRTRGLNPMQAIIFVAHEFNLSPRDVATALKLTYYFNLNS